MSEAVGAKTLVKEGALQLPLKLAFIVGLLAILGFALKEKED